MVVGEIVAAWKNGTSALVAIRVDEGDDIGDVEYIGSTPLLDSEGNKKSPLVLKTELIKVVKANRDAQLNGITVLSISGTVGL